MQMWMSVVRIQMVVLKSAPTLLVPTSVLATLVLGFHQIDTIAQVYIYSCLCSTVHIIINIIGTSD